jgi:hypothetical protein
MIRRFRTAEVPTVRAISALEQLHAELAGQLKQNEGERARLTDSMRHVEAVLRLLQPGYNVAAVAVRRRKPNPWIKRGTLLRRALDVLRTAEGPLTARELAERVLKAEGVTDPDQAEFYKLVKSMSAALISNRGRSFLVHDQRTPWRWSLKP